MQSSFISTNGGESFKAHRLWDYTRFDYNPHDANIVYAYNRQQVYISRDKGVTWDYFLPKADAVEKVGYNMQLSNAQNSTPKVIYKPGAQLSSPANRTLLLRPRGKSAGFAHTFCSSYTKGYVFHIHFAVRKIQQQI